MWFEKYVGLPYEQYNCAALLQKVWHEELNKILDIACNHNELSIYSDKMVIQACQYTRIEKPVDKCAVLMYSRYGLIGHLGIWVDFEGGYILHAHRSFTNSILQKPEQVYKANKLYGYYTCIK